MGEGCTRKNTPKLDNKQNAIPLILKTNLCIIKTQKQN